MSKRIISYFPSGPVTRLGVARKCGHLTKKNREYCKSCREAFYSKIIEKPCAECGETMVLCQSEARKYKCCSYECRNAQISKRQAGSNSHLWRGGVTDRDRILRNSAKYDRWRRVVFERDDYTCQKCGDRGGRLTADHIKEWFLYPDLRFDPENGRTLCLECHRKTESFGGRSYRKMLKLSKSGALQYRML